MTRLAEFRCYNCICKTGQVRPSGNSICLSCKAIMGSPEVMALYKAPFRYDGRSYIFDAAKEIVADFGLLAKGFRVRGWGRIQYMEGAVALNDAVEEFLTDLTNPAKTDPARCVELMNKAWANHKAGG